MHVPQYADVTNADFYLDPIPGKVCVINGKLCYGFPGWRLQGSDDTYEASDIWVPYTWRDANVVAAYKGGIAYNAVPNAQWSWTQHLNGGGSMSEVSDYTRFIDSAAGDYAYIQIIPPQNILNYLFFIEARCEAGSDYNDIGLHYDDKVNQIFELTWAYGGVAGRHRWLNNTQSCNYHDLGTASYKKILVIVDSNRQLVETWLYETMECINAADVAGFDATTTAAYLRIGCMDLGGAGTGEFRVQNYPAIAVLEQIY